MRLLSAFMAAALALGVAAPPAAAFLAQNGFRVEERGATSFEVPWSGRAGAPFFWCAAGDYVVRDLRLPPSTPIYRYSAPPRGRGQGILFGLDPRYAQRTGLVRIFGGRGVVAAHARAFCSSSGSRDR